MLRNYTKQRTSERCLKGWLQGQLMTEPGEHKQPWNTPGKGRHNNRVETVDKGIGIKSEISTYSYLFLLVFEETGYLPVVKWKIKTVEGKVPRPGSQRWEVKGRERKKFYLLFLPCYSLWENSAETGGLLFLSNLSYKICYDGWLTNSGFLSKSYVSLCSFAQVLPLHTYCNFFSIYIT